MAQPQKNPINPALALVAAAAGWFVPGLGHALLRKWSKAIVYFFAVVMLALIGLWMRGNVFSSNAADAFDMLGFLADIGSGIFYFLAGTINPAGADVSRASGDYGTRLFATAGVLNLLCVLEVLQIGFGSKEEWHAGP
ncbi:MAG: hypothetical protein DMG30_03750 [Acidobacteria bacterium]|nr:MAG: hypothetical protein DMG30_03750 [Acidobacteriota bacterium]